MANVIFRCTGYWLAALITSVGYSQTHIIEHTTPGNYFLAPSVVHIAGNECIAGSANSGVGDTATIFRFSPTAIVWAKVLFETSSFWGSAQIVSVLAAINGDILVSGFMRRNDAEAGMLARFTPDGDLLWCHTTGTDADYHMFRELIEVPTGELYAVGFTGTPSTLNEIVAKYDANGNNLWFREIATPGSQLAIDVQYQNDTLLVLATTTLGSGSGDIALIRFDPAGTLLTYRTIGTPGNEYPMRLCLDGSGGYVISFSTISGQSGIVRLDQQLTPIGNGLLISAAAQLNLGGGLEWYPADASFVLAGQAWTGPDLFGCALRMTMTGTLSWERSFTGAAFIGDMTQFSTGSTLILNQAPMAFTASGNGAAMFEVIDASTGHDVNGTSCYPERLFAPSATALLMQVQDHLVIPLLPAISEVDGAIARDIPLRSEICATVPLPVEFVALHAEVLGNAVRLGWTTATESNCDRYEVERLDPHGDWRRIGDVQGQGWESQPTVYSFDDQWPEAGINYYRLVQYDLDGGPYTTPVVSVDYQRRATGGPSATALLAAPGELIPGQGEMWVGDLSGRILAQSTNAVNAPSVPGVYVLGSRERVRRLLVH